MQSKYTKESEKGMQIHMPPTKTLTSNLKTTDQSEEMEKDIP